MNYTFIKQIGIFVEHLGTIGPICTHGEFDEENPTLPAVVRDHTPRNLPAILQSIKNKRLARGTRKPLWQIKQDLDWSSRVLKRAKAELLELTPKIKPEQVVYTVVPY